MAFNCPKYSIPGQEDIIFTLMDAIIFSTLTVVLSICTVQLFMFLHKLSHTSIREKCLIGSVCGLFTVSYISRTVYLFFEALFIEDKDCSCCLQYHNTIVFIALLPIFDAFPCAMVLTFDAVRFFCTTKQNRLSSQSSFKTALYSKTKGLRKESDLSGNMSSQSLGYLPDNQTATDSFATYDGGSSAHASFGPGNAKRPASSALVRKSAEKINDTNYLFSTETNN